MEVQEDDQKIIEHNKNKQCHFKEQGAQEVLVEKDMRVRSSRKHTTLVHFQKMMKY